MFNFGKNWRAFSQHALTQQSVAAASQSIKDLLQKDQFQGFTWLDLGCGSGLFSIAAKSLGATVTAADINPLCLQTTQDNAKRFLPAHDQMQVIQLSALDQQALAGQPPYDIVYSWGVLHHTGDMWQALINTAQLVKPNGKLVISIYNKHITSPVWGHIKHLYVSLPEIGQQLMAGLFAIVIYVAKFLATRHNPLDQARGMSFWYDVIDWIGGYPYQYATRDEIVQFMSGQNFKALRVVAAQVPTGCNEFVFVKGG